MRNGPQGVQVSILLVAAWLAVSMAGRGVPDEPMGSWEITPNTLVSGASCRIELRYTNGNADLPPGASFAMDFEPISVSQYQHGMASETWEPGSGDGLGAVRVTAGRQHSLGYTSITIQLPQGLRAGGRFAIVYGNKQINGPVIGLVNPTPVRDLAWNVRYLAGAEAEPVDWYERGWWKALPRVSIEPGPARAVRLVAPTLVRVGARFAVRVVVTDGFDSPAQPPHTGSVSLQAPPELSGVPGQVAFAQEHRSIRVVEGIAATKPGIYRLKASVPGLAGAWESNPIVVAAGAEEPLYWGMLHGHCGFSECWGDRPETYFSFGRDASGLDYLGISDHYQSLPSEKGSMGRLFAFRFGKAFSPRDAWLETIDAARKAERSGAFATLPGYEMATTTAGHQNVYWDAVTTDNYPRMFPTAPIDFPIENARRLGAVDTLVVPHLHASYIAYSSLHENRAAGGQVQTPVLECYSDWGAAFAGPGPLDPIVGGVREQRAQSLFRVIGRGLRLGLVGDSDTHTGLPGRRVSGGIAPGHRYAPGLTAIRSSLLSRRGVIDAYRKRHTYATSGERIYLDVRVGGAGMGEHAETDTAPSATVVVAGTATIAWVNLYDGARVLSQARPTNQRDARLVFALPEPTPHETPYMVEVVQVDQQRAWSSPVWVRRKTAPNLGWQRAGSGPPKLVNSGTQTARNIEVVGGTSSHPFVRPAWGPPGVTGEGVCVQAWLRRWDDRRGTLFLNWRGGKISGRVTLSGMTGYRVEPDRGQWWYGVTDDDGAGSIRFANTGGRVSELPGLLAGEWRGLCIDVTVSTARPCYASLELDGEALLSASGSTQSGRTLRVRINGLADDSRLTRHVVPELRPGQSWSPPSATGCWAVDPGNAIAESNEGDNLFVPAR